MLDKPIDIGSSFKEDEDHFFQQRGDCVLHVKRNEIINNLFVDHLTNKKNLIIIEKDEFKTVLIETMDKLALHNLL